ncbi:PREDICTED: uncharacterized protein LOC105146827 [Acromyrmex echinatior]|uniref:uncharacterized protein LOC105146827 n=1 Tax=Acromyrmex echinatior TaxID=103372 RepID=UPI000580DFE3|nr:PREDICTED: uncharacterized protein LOC105146827 [Acromyrmex echinatior]
MLCGACRPHLPRIPSRKDANDASCICIHEKNKSLFDITKISSILKSANNHRLFQVSPPFSLSFRPRTLTLSLALSLILTNSLFIFKERFFDQIRINLLVINQPQVNVEDNDSKIIDMETTIYISLRKTVR